MSDLKKDIANLLKEQADIVPRLEAMDENLENLSGQIERYIDSAWEAFGQTIELHAIASPGGSHCVDFEWDVLLDIPAYVLRGDNNAWVKVIYDNDYEETYQPVDPPIDIEDLEAFATRMSNELGILVRSCQRVIPTRAEMKKTAQEEGCMNFNGLNALYDDDLDLVKRGQVWYKGWDISDEFIICRKRSNNDWIIAYSTTGHGGGFDVILEKPTKEELLKFIGHVEQDSDNSDVHYYLGI